MNRGDFLQRFQSIDEQIFGLTQEMELKRAGFKELEAMLDNKLFVKKVLSGLKNPPKNDPGKYEPLYTFVSSVTQNDILTAEEPILFKQCPACKEDKPVLMEYLQVYDSPDGDEWRKLVFVLCERDGAHNVQSLIRGYRF